MDGIIHTEGETWASVAILSAIFFFFQFSQHRVLHLSKFCRGRFSDYILSVIINKLLIYSNRGSDIRVFLHLMHTLYSMF